MAANIKDWSTNDLENIMLDDINLSREQGGEVAKLMGAIKRKFDDVDVQIAGVAGAYIYKGTVDSVEDLPEAGNQVGDVYNVTSGTGGGNYAWDGAEWDKTGDSLVDVDGAQVLAKGSTAKRTLGERFADVVNVKDFGAAGDGVTDDAQAIRDANDAAEEMGATVYFPPGSYACETQIVAKASWVMDGCIKFAGSGDGNNFFFVSVGTSGKSFNINIDCDGKNLRCAVNISGSSNSFSSIKIKNLTATTFDYVSAGVVVSGSNNSFEFVSIVNFVHDFTGGNDSLPQGFCFIRTATDNFVATLYCNGCVAALVTDGSSSNSVGQFVVLNSSDNGLYALSGSIQIGSMLCHNVEEPIVSTGAEVLIGQAVLRGFSNAAVVISNCPYISLGSLQAYSSGAESSSGLLKTRPTNTSSGKIQISNVTGQFTDFMFSLVDGTIDYLSVSGCKIKLRKTSAIDHITYLTSCKSFSLDNFDVKIVDVSDVFTSSTTLYFSAPTTNLVKKSFIRDVKFSLTNSTETAETEATLRLNNFSNELIYADGFVWRVDIGPYIMFNKDIVMIPNSCNTTPSVGYWKAGTILLYGYISSSAVTGYVCVAAGSPGTWKTFTLPAS